MEQINKTLFGVPKSGTPKQWSVYVEGNTVIVEWGRVGGKMQQKQTPCFAKNIGKANATTPHEQAIKEANSKWENQYKEKYYRPTLEEAESMKTYGVQLSKKFIEDGDKLPEICYISAKLDGVRCKAIKNGNTIDLVSRGNDIYPIWDSIYEELNMLFNAFPDLIIERQLDGELYIHSVPLQKILSYVRVYDAIQTERIVYNIFDIPQLSKKTKHRFSDLEKIKQFIIDNNLKKVCVVDHHLGKKSKYEEYDQQFVNLGYEGVMFNNPEGGYEFQNRRTADIQKYKSFEDSEALVIGCNIDNNDGEGVLVLKWKNPKGIVVEFNCKMKGNHEYRLYENQCKLIGKWINFKYQALTIEGKPTFGVGIYVRECDEFGNPIE